jgi:hypothetical protein
MPLSGAHCILIFFFMWMFIIGILTLLNKIAFIDCLQFFGFKIRFDFQKKYLFQELPDPS